MSKKRLSEIIKENPNATAIIDNDCWVLVSDKLDEDGERIEIISSDSDNFIVNDDGGYGSGNCYGGDILQALAEIVGLNIESV